MTTISIHPFPARMAPEIALKHVSHLPNNSLVLDPMAGSGTVLWHAARHGHRSIGFDLDPLAVLISRVRTSVVNTDIFSELAEYMVNQAAKLRRRKLHLPWIDHDEETQQFIEYWFATPQIKQLRPLAHLLSTDARISAHPAEANALRLCLSKLIVTKQRGASLAWDVSHSRPHKVAEENDFDVLHEFAKATTKLGKYFQASEPRGDTAVEIGDARSLVALPPNVVDAVITSPPYLNAIDYLRGHKLSLVWLGCTVSHLRAIRANSIGAERSASGTRKNHAQVEPILSAFGNVCELPSKHQKMIVRYAIDVGQFTAEMARVLKPGGKCVFVVGNSCLKGVFINNSAAVSAASRLAGLILVEESKRELPSRSRYLPISVTQDNALGKRMRSEIVMTLRKPS